MGLDSFTVVFVVFLPVWKNQSEEDDLSAYFQISKAVKIIQSLRNLLACGQLATEEACREFMSLRTISDEGTCEEFLVLADVPQLFTGALRSLCPKVRVFSSEEQVGYTNLAEMFHE